MGERVIVFGIKDYAELAHYYLEHDSPHEVVAFCVNEKHMPSEREFKGLPVVPFENVENSGKRCTTILNVKDTPLSVISAAGPPFLKTRLVIIVSCWRIIPYNLLRV
jgi:hypothetical protein